MYKFSTWPKGLQLGGGGGGGGGGVSNDPKQKIQNLLLFQQDPVVFNDYYKFKQYWIFFGGFKHYRGFHFWNRSPERQASTISSDRKKLIYQVKTEPYAKLRKNGNH